MNPDNKELMDMLNGAKAARAESDYPKVVWQNPDEGLRVVEFYDTEQRKVCCGMEHMQGYDLTGKPVWRRVSPSNSDQMEVVVRYLLRTVSRRDPSMYYGRDYF